MKLRSWVEALAIIGLGWIGFVAGDRVPGTKQVAAFLELRDVAGLVFGVVGVWIAVLYSPGLHALWSKDLGSEEQREYEKVRPLLRPLSYSVVVLLATVPLQFIASVLYSFELSPLFLSELRRCSMAMLGALVGMQFFAVLLIILPVLDLRHRFRLEEVKRNARRRFSP